MIKSHSTYVTRIFASNAAPAAAHVPAARAGARKFAPAAACALLLLLTALGGPASARATQRRPARLRFPPGASVVRVKGAVQGRGEVVYVVGGVRGRRLTARLRLGGDDYAALQVRGPRGELLPSDDGTDAGTEWSAALRTSGDYRVVVFGPDTAGPRDVARYTLEVSLK